MKKKTWLMIAVICFLLVLAVAITIAHSSAPQDVMMNMFNRVKDVLEDESKKQPVTKVSNLVYSDNEGNTIVYHICITTYCEKDSANQTGLNTEAIAAVIAPDEAENCRECNVSGLPAAIYHKDGRAYLCWTIIPELSCVIEYDPDVESEDDMIRMAQSVPANQGNTNNP